MYILETNYWYGTWHEHDYQYKAHTLYLEDDRWYTSKKAAITYFKKPQNTIEQIILLFLKGTQGPQCSDKQQWPTE